jgi:hypothetical protein
MKFDRQTVVKALKNPRSAWQTGLLTLIVALSYYVRSSQYLLKPQLFAEDGRLWLAEGYHRGITSIFNPVNGFFHTPERLFGWVVAQLPLHYAPLLFVLCAWGLFILLSYYLFSSRTKILTNNFERIFAAGALCLIANINELIFNFSNSVFLMGIIGVMILFAQKPKNRVGAIAEKIFFVLSCLTLPFAWFYVPIVLVERYKYKRKDVFFFYTSIVTAIAQVICYLASHVNRSPITFLSLWSKWTVLELYNQMIIPAVRFARLDTLVAEYSAHHYEVFAVYLVFAAILVATIVVLRKSNKQVWYLLFFLAAMTFASVKSPTLSVKLPEDALKTMAVVKGGSRYFVYGIIAVTLVYVKASYLALAPKARYIFLVFFMALGLLTSLHYHVFFIDKQFTDFTSEYNQKIDSFNASKHATVTIDINPSPWYLTLVK